MLRSSASSNCSRCRLRATGSFSAAKAGLCGGLVIAAMLLGRRFDWQGDVRNRVSDPRLHSAKDGGIVSRREAGIGAAHLPSPPVASDNRRKQKRREGTMRGLMQDWPLLCHKIIDHAAIQHGTRDVVSRSVEGPIHRTNYREIRERAPRGREASRCRRLPARRPCRHARLEHLAASRGLVRPRSASARSTTRSTRGSFPEQIAWIVNDAEDRMLFVDLTFLPLVEKLAAPFEVGREDRRAHRRGAHAGDDSSERRALRGMARRGDADFAWRVVRREHRRRHVLHLRHDRQPEGRRLLASLATSCTRIARRSAPDVFGIRATTRVMPVVPMFHANCWGLAFTAPLAGAAMVMPGATPRRRLDLRAPEQRAGHAARRRCRRSG